MDDDWAIRFVYFAFPLSVPALILVGGLVFWWLARARGAGAMYPESEMHGVDDLFHALLLCAFVLYALMARRIVYGGGTGVILATVFLNVRLERKRGVAGWPLALALLACFALAWRLTHPLIPELHLCHCSLL